MAIAIEDLGSKEVTLVWFEDLLSFELAPVLTMLVILVVLYKFRVFVLGFTIFSVKLAVTIGVLLFILQFLPTFKEITTMSLVAGVKRN